MKNTLSKRSGLFPVGGLGPCLVLIFLSVHGSAVADDKTLPGHVPPEIAKLQLEPKGQLPPTDKLNLAIGLPLHNTDDLTNLLRQLYSPGNTNFHRYLTPKQFRERFGPTEAEYQKVIDFATTNGFEVRGKYDNGQVLGVTAKVSDIERAFHLTMATYRHPVENRDFFAPDSEPTVDASLPILDVCGLNNYRLPHTFYHRIPRTPPDPPLNITASGTGPFGTFQGQDFRNAYAPGVSLTGTGQIIGIFQWANWNPADITGYEQTAGLPTNILVTSQQAPGWIPNNFGNANLEATVDIEMAISMAPGATIAVFQANFLTELTGFATQNPQILQWTDSIGADDDGGGGADNGFMTMAAQGQSMFIASGDNEANTVSYPADSPWVTSVGGTEILETQTPSGATNISEAVWNNGFDPVANQFAGSCGGVSSYSIPWWQQGAATTANQGSTTMRNVPDVAMLADHSSCFFNGQTKTDFEGTSQASPLWAGFCALVNEQLGLNNQSPIGFPNPTVYVLGQAPQFFNAFNDVTNGNNEWPNSPTQFTAQPGYDLCTGWGSPNGSNFINAVVIYNTSIWVDFNSTSNPSNAPDSQYIGSFWFPEQTMAAAAHVLQTAENNNVEYLTTLWLKSSGTSAETLTITNPITIRAWAGPATIGRH